MAAGIYGFFFKEKSITKAFDLFSDFNGITDEHSFSTQSVGRKVINKLHQDRFFKTKDKVTICFEGINLSESVSNPDDFFDSYLKEGIAFAKDLRGVYSGFVLDEKEEKIYIYNDNLATKSIYYYYDKDNGFAFASELQVLSKAFRKYKIDYSLNKDAVYMMALYGLILDNQTYMLEVKNLPYSSILIYDYKNNKLEIKKIQRYSNKKIDISYSDAIDTIENLLTQSIKRNWEKSKQYNNTHFSLLSGGMDARVNTLLAKEIGYKNINSFTFGQSGSKDIAYALEIASGENFNHLTRYLDSGNYLLDNIYHNYIIPNDGMIMFQGSAHMFSSLSFLDLSPYSIMHSGQIGDALFGSFTTSNFNFWENRANIGATRFVKNEKLLDKIESLPKILDGYQSLGYDLYIFEQHVIHGTIMGDKSLGHIIDSISPFYDKELIEFCISLPNKYKKHQLIYFDWLKKYHPNIVNYTWDKTNMKPNKKYKIVYGKLFKKYFNGAKKYFNINYESMNPFGTWIKRNNKILQVLDDILNDEITKSYIDEELKNDFKQIYKDDIFESRNKFTVITALLAIKLHFGKEF